MDEEYLKAHEAEEAKAIARNEGQKGFWPCDPAPVIPERKMVRYLTEK